MIETKEFSPDARRMIPVIPTESADAFKSRYVTLGELVATQNLHFKSAIPILEKAGVRPLFAKSEAGCFIYERKSAEAAFGKRH